jgi:hypothetical protein
MKRANIAQEIFITKEGRWLNLERVGIGGRESDLIGDLRGISQFVMPPN